MFGAGAVRAEQFTDLSWTDLIPEGQPLIPPGLQNFIQHDGPDMSGQQPASSGMRMDWNGQTVRLPGYIVPIDFSATGVTAFILVPFVGACIHVPPPPANQLVFVTAQTPFQVKGLFDAVKVTGVFGVSPVSTHIAQISYAMAASSIVPFGA
ncbi:DUF3299 domain-containing protein [Parasphingorhabdus sp.]|uniref:DUF3299 domain-containing protein n=1 Tax=Parasphingorhabdus sp. TaxID=2709688 RepID=UPI003296D019